MSRAIRKKLNNHRGMSILYAMIMFMMMAMVSAVLLAASLTSAKAAQNDYDEEQSFLTTESAAKLMEQNLSGKTINITTTTQVDEAGIETTQTNVEIPSQSNPDTYYCLELLKEAVEKIGNGNGNVSFSRDMTVTVEGKDNMEKVLTTFNMDKDFNITMPFTMEESEDRTVPYLIMRLKPVITTVENNGETETGQPITSVITTITWSFDSLSNMSERE